MGRIRFLQQQNHYLFSLRFSTAISSVRNGGGGIGGGPLPVRLSVCPFTIVAAVYILPILEVAPLLGPPRPSYFCPFGAGFVEQKFRRIMG